jgi:alpha-glucuronidase
MGPIQDRTREHLGTSDRIIMANRRMLLAAIDAVQAGQRPPGTGDPALAGQMTGPDTVDGIAPAGTWGTWWRAQVEAKRNAAPWAGKAPAPAPGEAQDA